jgi:hypothetical protein
MKFRFIYIALITIGCSRKEPHDLTLKNKELPSFKILLNDSATYLDTKEIPSGKPTIFLYYSPHCPYSRAQIKEIVNNINTMPEIQFFIITSWPFAEMKNIYVRYQLNKFPQIKAGLDYNRFFGNYYGVKGVPFLVFYNKDKKFITAFEGIININQIKEAIQN